MTSSTTNLRTFARGFGRVDWQDSECLLSLENASDLGTSNAQLDDYHWKKRKDFSLTPPLKLQLEAKWIFTGDLPQGTSGFGLWNDPFMMTGWRWPSLPQAFWFFVGCPKSQLSLLPKLRHHTGLRAFQVNAWSASFLKHILLWLLRGPFWNVNKWREKWLPKLCSDIELCEYFLSLDLREWQKFEIVWTKSEVIFKVNGLEVQNAPCSIRSRLGFVIWMDNQYLYFDPWKKIKWGSCAIENKQSLHIRNLSMVNE